MSEREENLEKNLEILKTRIREGREYFDRHGDLPLGYVTGTVSLTLNAVLKDLCREIEKHHKLKEPEGGKENFVIHYTGIGTLVSMLQQAVKNKQNATCEQNEAKDGENKVKHEQHASLRLYDSAHFNDPEEGNYLVRSLKLLENDDRIDKKKASHAYIASFIIPDTERDMSDDLVFWRIYGKEGEGCSLKLDVPSCKLRKVRYGSGGVEQTIKILQPVLNSLYPLLSIPPKYSLRERVRKALTEIFEESLGGILYLYKSEAYEYERECRFIIHRPDIDESKICFEYQEQNNFSARIRHYCENEALAIKKILPSKSSITVGPCVPYRSDVSNCLEILKRRAEIYGPEIKTSKISYRKP